MEKVEIFHNAEAYNNSVELLNSSLEMQRFSYHKGRAHAFQSAQRKETDTHVYWAYTEAKPRFENNRLFYSRNNKYGFTYDKATKDFKFWFGRSIHEIPPFMLYDVFKHFNIDWYGILSPSLASLLNATMVKNMIKGKITNPRDYVKAYLKTSPYRKSGISPELFYKTFANGNVQSPKSYRRIIEYATDPNHALEFIANHGNGYINHSITDLYDQAAILDKRVNPKWSEARMKEVHAEWTREIMGIEIKSLKECDYEYSDITLPEGLKIISNNYELFEEGTTMKHCVYTNYESRIRSKKYFAFRYEKDGIRATLGVELSYADAKFSQMYGIGNSSIPIDITDSMKEFINTEYFQKWCAEQSKALPSREREPVEDDILWF